MKDIKNMTKQQLREEKRESKKVTYKDLADYLEVSESAVKKWDAKRRELMLLGLSIKKN